MKEGIYARKSHWQCIIFNIFKSKVGIKTDTSKFSNNDQTRIYNDIWSIREQLIQTWNKIANAWEKIMHDWKIKYKPIFAMATTRPWRDATFPLNVHYMWFKS